MSFDLYMWHQKVPLTTSPTEFFESLSDGEGSGFAEPLSREIVLSAFRKQFPGLKDTGGEIEWEGDRSYFQACLTYDEQEKVTSVQLSCGFELCRTPSFARIYEVAHDLGYRVYDPQSSKVLVPVAQAGGLRALGARLAGRKWVEERA